MSRQNLQYILQKPVLLSEMTLFVEVVYISNPAIALPVGDAAKGCSFMAALLPEDLLVEAYSEIPKVQHDFCKTAVH